MHTENITAVQKIFSKEFDMGEHETSELFSEFSNNLELLTINDEAVSMLFLVDAQYYFKTACRKLKYIFGAVTREEFRSKGYMKELIARCADKAKDDGYGGVFLYPASQNLRDYYRKLGFKDAFVSLKAESAPDAECSMSDAYNFFPKHRDGVVVPERNFLAFQQKHDNARFCIDNSGLYLLRGSTKDVEVLSNNGARECEILSYGMAILFDDEINIDANLIGIYD